MYRQLNSKAELRPRIRVYIFELLWPSERVWVSFWRTGSVAVSCLGALSLVERLVWASGLHASLLNQRKIRLGRHERVCLQCTVHFLSCKLQTDHTSGVALAFAVGGVVLTTRVSWRRFQGVCGLSWRSLSSSPEHSDIWILDCQWLAEWACAILRSNMVSEIFQKRFWRDVDELLHYMYMTHFNILKVSRKDK